MMEGAERIITFVCAIAAVLLQAIVAPSIALFHAIPNFVLAFVMVVAVVRAQSCGIMLPFVLGLLLDFLGTGPLGAWAFAFALVSFLVSRAMCLLDNDTLFMPLFLVLVGVFLCNLLYAALFLMCGGGLGVLEALAFRALPCALYDAVLGLIMFPLFRALVARHAAHNAAAPFLS